MSLVTEEGSGTFPMPCLVQHPSIHRQLKNVYTLIDHDMTVPMFKIIIAMNVYIAISYELRRCVMSESSHKCNVIRLRAMNFIIAVTTRVCHAQIA